MIEVAPTRSLSLITGPVQRCCTKLLVFAESASLFSLALGARPLCYDERLGQYAFLSP